MRQTMEVKSPGSPRLALAPQKVQGLSCRVQNVGITAQAATKVVQLFLHPRFKIYRRVPLKHSLSSGS